MNRRRLVKNLLLASIPFPALSWSDVGNKSARLFASSCSDKSGKYFVAAFDTLGELKFKTQVEGRCHGAVQDPGNRNVAFFFARRPGRFLLRVDLETGIVTHRIQSDKGRHFYGHGCFDPTGKCLITTENNYVNQEGLIVIRDATTLQVVAEYLSGGIGPHECAMLNHKPYIVVANGGILTHPNEPRKKLNLHSMQPNLAYIEMSSGKCLRKLEPSHHQLSIRHFAVAPNDQIVVGMQYQGGARDSVPLVAFHDGEGKFIEAQAPLAIQQKMKQYTASVAIDNESRYAVVTAPRGNLATVWDIKKRQFEQATGIRDSAGVAFDSSDNRFVLSDGFGKLSEMKKSNFAVRQLLKKHSDLKWDNHLTSMS